MGKDSTEVVAFMTLFARLKDWGDDAPEKLFEFAKSDSSIKDLCTQVYFAAHYLKMNERRHRALFAAPVDPSFVVAWRDFEDRYETVLSSVWLVDILPELGRGEPPRTPKADLQWDNADDEAEQQSRGIQEAIDFAEFNSKQDWRWDDSPRISQMAAPIRDESGQL